MKFAKEVRLGIFLNESGLAILNNALKGSTVLLGRVVAAPDNETVYVKRVILNEDGDVSLIKRRIVKRLQFAATKLVTGEWKCLPGLPKFSDKSSCWLLLNVISDLIKHGIAETMEKYDADKVTVLAQKIDPIASMKIKLLQDEIEKVTRECTKKICETQTALITERDAKIADLMKQITRLQGVASVGAASALAY